MQTQEITSNEIEHIQSQAYNCIACKDSGIIEWEEDGYVFSKDCECEIKRREMARTKRHIEQSGLVNVLEEMSFENYRDDNQARAEIKKRAIEFLEKDSWWFISGNIGAGKSHITTAICGELINRGTAVYYMSWKREAIKLKMNMSSDNYKETIKRLTSVEVLYIDDFLKGNITTADIDLAYVLINDRYAQNKKTLISTELNLEELKQLDEAIASRIYQKTDERYRIEIKKLKNHRYGG